ncbi:T9SS type A sorting domain-containing protein [Flavobacterium sp. UBA6026]|uniref:T9SS type A sorting domain-containing protein n=1 Tax=Flavobacterium sp. UBA6026 TaxID=1946550 RepID=UPI0025BBCFDE|nr:T9SS type A sorting domain-containing protein [Flavobacterium sp. UBA6026]
MTLPGNYSTLNASAGATVTQFPSGSGTSVTFKGKFSDTSGTQVFTVTYSNGSYSFPFTKVKSLFGGYKEGNTVSQIVAPMCETTSIPFSITGDQYRDISTNPITYFGSINNYDYIIPAGWRLNGILSTGSNWISASGSVTLTPDASTGGGSVLQYIAKSDCSNAFFQGTARYVSIVRPIPTFSISPASMQIACGTTPTQIFTVNASSSTACSVSYVWNLGVNNGWLYGGSPAPATINTSTNSITLTSANGNTLPASVYVTPIYNSVAQTQLKCTIDFTPFTSTAVISGGTSSFCTLQSTSIFTIDAGAGNTVTWSSSNSGIATVSGGTNSQVTVTAQSQGLFYVNARITNPCGQWVDKTSFSITVGTPMASIDGYTCVTESAPCSLNVTANNNYLAFSLSAPLGSYTPLDSDWQWEKIYGNFYFLENGQYNSATHTGIQGNIYITGANPTDNPLQFRCRVRNSCAWGQWRTYTWNDGTTTPVVPPTPPAEYFIVYPNPAGTATGISLADINIKPNSPPTTAELYSISGVLQSTSYFNNYSSGFYVGNLFSGSTYYIIIHFSDGSTEGHTLYKS